MNDFPYAQRRRRLAERLAELDAKAMLISDEANVRYLSGFTGEDSYLYLDTSGEAVFLTDGRFVEQLRQECGELAMEIRTPRQTLTDFTAEYLAGRKGRIALERHSLTAAANEAICSQLQDPVASPMLVERLREVKDDREVVAIEQAIRVAEAAFRSVVPLLRRHASEQDVAAELDHAMRRAGASAASFTTIIAAGARAALPHARPTSRAVGGDGFALIDWGASVGGYCSDLTRVLVGDTIPAQIREIYEIVREAQRAAIDSLRPGVAMEGVDAAARSVIQAAGFGEHFNHSVGHGIGLRVHETVRLAAGQKRPLQEGMVVTIEPGIYLPGVGGVRIEDDCLVTKEGCRVLSRLPSSLEDNRIDWF